MRSRRARAVKAGKYVLSIKSAAPAKALLSNPRAVSIERMIFQPEIFRRGSSALRPWALSSRKAADEVMQRSTALNGRPRTTRSRQRFTSVISLDPVLQAGCKGDEPFVAADVAILTRSSELQSQGRTTDDADADRPSIVAAVKPVQNQADVHLGEMVVGDQNGRIGGCGVKNCSLEAEFHTGRSSGISFEAKIFLENPDDIRGVALPREQPLPFRKSVLMRSGLMMMLATILSIPVTLMPSLNIFARAQST